MECDRNAILARCRAAILSHRPELDGAPVTVHADGWDCLAVEIGGTLIFKIPHHDSARERLSCEPRALDLIRPRTRLAVPRMRLLPGPPLMSEHEKLPGVAVDPARYATLSEAARARLALDIATFFADLHAIDPALVSQAGCDALRPWQAPEAYLGRIEGKVEASVLAMVREALAAHARHGEDVPVFGQFDTHGWNMAYDLGADRLHGLFDFAGAGVGALHRDLSYPLFVSADLADRVVAIYRAATGRAVDLERVYDAHVALRAIELCDEWPEDGNGTKFVAALARCMDLRRQL